MLQEAWATISPRVNLNVDSISEKKLKRRLVRLAALLEEADEGFLSLWEEVKDVAVLVPPVQDPGTSRDETISAERTFSEEELYSFLKDIADFNPRESLAKGVVAKKVSMDKLQPFCRDIPGYELEPFSGGTKFRNGDTIMARITPCLEIGRAHV